MPLRPAVACALCGGETVLCRWTPAAGPVLWSTLCDGAGAERCGHTEMANRLRALRVPPVRRMLAIIVSRLMGASG